MRLVFILLGVGVVIAVTIFALVLAGFIGYQIYNTTKQVAENITHQYNSTINISDYDVVQKVQPVWLILDYALILAFIFMVVAVFMHSRKR